MRGHSDEAYCHTQVGPWSLILLAFGIVSLVVAWIVRHEPVVLLIVVRLATFLKSKAGAA